MRSNGYVVLALTLSCGAAALAAKPSAFGNQSKPMKAIVHILAVSSSSRQSFAGNQDIYLADVQVKGGEHRFARLIDQYPGFGLPIRESPAEGSHFVHDASDPASPSAMCRDRKSFYTPAIRAYSMGASGILCPRTPADAIPCFRSVHQSIQIARK